MDSITIGVLLPNSTIFPISKEFEKGLKEGLKSHDIEVELVKEFIGGGDIKLTENACNKFFSFDDVDVVTGVISNKAAATIAERFKGKGIPLLVNNPGGHVPPVTEYNEYIFINSMHLWRHAWTLGHWGVQTFGKKGMYLAAVYDAGYGFSQMFYEGMMAAGATAADWSFSVPPMPQGGGLTDMSIIFPFLEQYQPDFIFANFCGAETTLFLNEFIARGWHHKTKVLGLPYLLAPFEPLNDDLTVYTTLPIEEAPDVSAATAFRYLGLQAGKYISQAAANATGKAELRAELAKIPAMFNVASGIISAATQLTLSEHTITAGNTEISSKALTRHQAFPIDIPKLTQLTAQPGAGWFNPYLGI